MGAYIREVPNSVIITCMANSSMIVLLCEGMMATCSTLGTKLEEAKNLHEKLKVTTMHAPCKQ